MIALAGCRSIPSPDARVAGADHLADQQGWHASVIAAGKFSLTAYLPRTITPSPSLTVYIEGDGLAWVGGSRPSQDPTPVDPLALRLALAQPAGNAAYLARPCQFAGRSDSACAESYWTDGRFSREVVEFDQHRRRCLDASFRGRSTDAGRIFRRRRHCGARCGKATGCRSVDHGCWKPGSRRLDELPQHPATDRVGESRKPDCKPAQHSAAVLCRREGQEYSTGAGNAFFGSLPAGSAANAHHRIRFRPSLLLGRELAEDLFRDFAPTVDAGQASKSRPSVGNAVRRFEGQEAAIALSNVIRPFGRPSVTQLKPLGGCFLFSKPPEDLYLSSGRTGS